jgi:hypothetical protein
MRSVRTIAKEAAMNADVSRRRVLATGAFVAVLAAAGPVRLAAQVNRREPDSQNAVTPAEIDRRLEQRTAELRKVAPQGGDRYVLFDLAYPRDEAEYRAVGKSALVFLAALSRSSDELPLRRVYTRVGRQEVELRRLGSRRSELPPSSVARQVIGRFREDAFWLAPVGPLLRENALLCDFAKNRTGFELNRGPFEPPDFIRADRAREKADKPQDAAVKAFAEREYAGFGLIE